MIRFNKILSLVLIIVSLTAAIAAWFWWRPKQEAGAATSQIQEKNYQASWHNYPLQGLSLIDTEGNSVALSDELLTDKTVVVNFIFTTCTTICPVMTAIMAQFQKLMGDDIAQVKLVSISIDAQYDNPARLKQYGEKFNAGEQWHFYTSTRTENEKIQRAFDAYRGSKMNHIPLFYIKSPDKAQWLRLEGLISAAELMAEYKSLALNR